jgi:methionyl-tRNA synthetase
LDNRIKKLVQDTLRFKVKMKLARPCPVCGEVGYANKCKSCGHEFMPETPKPKMKPKGKKPIKKKPGKFLKF